LTELADWIADQNRLGGSASKAGLKRKINRNGNIVGAYFVVADLEKELKAEKEAKVAAMVKRSESIEAAHEKDRADMYGVRGSPPESRTSPNHLDEKLIAVSVSNKALAKTTVGMNKNRMYEGEDRVVVQVGLVRRITSIPSMRTCFCGLRRSYPKTLRCLPQKLQSTRSLSCRPRGCCKWR
jgi:hypothetical protein